MTPTFLTLYAPNKRISLISPISVISLRMRQRVGGRWQQLNKPDKPDKSNTRDKLIGAMWVGGSNLAPETPDKPDMLNILSKAMGRRCYDEVRNRPQYICDASPNTPEISYAQCSCQAPGVE